MTYEQAGVVASIASHCDLWRMEINCKQLQDMFPRFKWKVITLQDAIPVSVIRVTDSDHPEKAERP